MPHLLRTESELNDAVSTVWISPSLILQLRGGFLSFSDLPEAPVELTKARLCDLLGCHFLLNEFLASTTCCHLRLHWLHLGYWRRLHTTVGDGNVASILNMFLELKTVSHVSNSYQFRSTCDFYLYWILHTSCLSVFRERGTPKTRFLVGNIYKEQLPRTNKAYRNQWLEVISRLTHVFFEFVCCC